ncbi:uncharacterized protein UHO2_07240 [Ustilago hordei]|uniref:Wings apart-like protein C-terminal domain-containing protein n=1 Tax=Ustilago hordei TaxID=120017 RepID=I2FUQ7_USTHO|nr:uncharacterized protein UHO2_07240 [Ustilago hordei]CCF50650.1 uncharacterized protein UHOR_06189 [Ustilago hordei]SYW77398.1 uncharacterized protein UHO2_07240 [Ustilago hordei]
MDFSSLLRRKPTAVTYGKRSRGANGSADSFPATERPNVVARCSSGSSDEDDQPAGPSDTPRGLTHAEDGALSPCRPLKQSPRDRMPTQPIADTISPSTQPPPRTLNGASTRSPTATSSASITPTAHIPASLSTPSIFPNARTPATALGSTSSLPPRPHRAASPSATKSNHASSSKLPLRRSASSSPRKVTPSALSPSKRAAPSRTPSRPAQDLSGLFDSIEPTLPRSTRPFARSESQPTAQLHRDVNDTLLDTAPAFANSPLASPTLPSSKLAEEELLSPGTLTSPSKRPRMADRMAPRAARSTKSKADEVAESLFNSSKGSLRRTETAPSAVSEATSIGLFASDGDRAASIKAKQDDAASGRQSDAGSTPIDAASQADSQSQEGMSSAMSAPRLAGIKQTSAANARRTYGLQRSFLADQAEENLLFDPSSKSNGASRSIEDEIQAELKGNGTSTSSNHTSRPSPSVASRLADSATAAPRESYAELLKKWGEGADDIEWDESQDPTLNLKSITSLRSTGELRRFNDDLEYLFSGLDPSQALSIRRSSAVELVRLLCGKPDIDSLNDAAGHDDNDAEEEEKEEEEAEEAEDPLVSAQSAEFLRKLKASDLIARLLDLFRGAEAGEGVDGVLDAAVAVYIAKLLKSPSSAEPLTRERCCELFTTLREVLLRADRSERQSRKDGFALLRLHELKQHKIASKSDRRTLGELRAIARISKLFVAGAQSWTLRNLVLAACCSLIALPRRILSDAAIKDLLVDDDTADDGFHPSLFTTVLNVLVAEGAKAQQRLVDFSKGLQLVTPTAVEAVPDLETVDVCIRFLDKGMDILYLELDQAVPASNETLDALQNLISFAVQAAPFGSPPQDVPSQKLTAWSTRALQVLHALFKTLLDLSQVDANWSESLANSLPLGTLIIRAFLLSHRCATSHRQTSTSLNAGLFDDVQHLTLALLTNLLIKQQIKASNTLQSIQIDPSCWGRRTCTPISCNCTSRSPALATLARVLFETRNAAREHDDSNAAYLSNSIATALAQFAVGGKESLELCRRVLDEQRQEKGGSGLGGLRELVDAVEEFALVHQAALVAGQSEATREADGLDEEREEEAAVKQEGEGGQNAVAEEAGQLIKDLALRLRELAKQ